MQPAAMGLKQYISLAAILSVSILLSIQPSLGELLEVEQEQLRAIKCDGQQQFFPHPSYCTKFFQCVHGVPTEASCPASQVWSPALTTCVIAGSEQDTCTRDHPVRECKRRTVDFIPASHKCQAYYDCFNPNSYSNYVYGNPYERECKHPNQFDIYQKKCVSYKMVSCGKGRKIAVWYCDYKINQCHGRGHCRPCSVEHPSCVGHADGKYPAPYSTFSPRYFECKDQRCTDGGIQWCPRGQYFNPNQKKCVVKVSNVVY